MHGTYASDQYIVSATTLTDTHIRFWTAITMRVTRAAQRAQLDVEQPVEAPEANERVLKDIEPNASPAAQDEEPLPAKTPAKTPSKKGKGKGAKKGARGKKTKTEEEELAEVVEEADQQAVGSTEQDRVQESKDGK